MAFGFPVSVMMKSAETGSALGTPLLTGWLRQRRYLGAILAQGRE